MEERGMVEEPFLERLMGKNYKMYQHEHESRAY
jgi:hypothetical protein